MVIPVTLQSPQKVKAKLKRKTFLRFPEVAFKFDLGEDKCNTDVIDIVIPKKRLVTTRNTHCMARRPLGEFLIYFC